MDKPVIEIYGTQRCGYCTRAKALCEAQGYPFVYFDMTDDRALQDEFTTRTNGARTVPQIFVGIRKIGGHDDLVEAHRSGVLQQLLGGF